MTTSYDERDNALTPFERFCLLLFVIVLLVIALIVIVPAFAASPDVPQCHIVGYVYGAADLDEVDTLIEIPTHCLIRVERFERRLVLSSRRWIVEILLPDRGGWLRFAYTWGSDRAYIGAAETIVFAGPRDGLVSREVSR